MELYLSYLVLLDYLFIDVVASLVPNFHPLPFVSAGDTDLL